MIIFSFFKDLESSLSISSLFDRLVNDMSIPIDFGFKSGLLFILFRKIDTSFLVVSLSF